MSYFRPIHFLLLQFSCSIVHRSVEVAVILNLLWFPVHLLSVHVSSALVLLNTPAGLNPIHLQTAFPEILYSRFQGFVVHSHNVLYYKKLPQVHLTWYDNKGMKKLEYSNHSYIKYINIRHNCLLIRKNFDSKG